MGEQWGAFAAGIPVRGKCFVLSDLVVHPRVASIVACVSHLELLLSPAQQFKGHTAVDQY